MISFKINNKQEKLSYIAFIFIFLIIVFYLALASKSLWLDECIAAWVTLSNYQDVLIRSSENLWQSSFYYILLYFWKTLFGNNEFILRLPSYIAIIISTWIVYLSGKLIKDKICGLIAAMAFLLRDGIFAEVAISARSYALALCCSIIATYAILNWIQNKNRIYLAIWLFSTVIATYFHYMYAGVILAHVFLLVATSTYLTKKELICLFLSGILLLTPTFDHIITSLSGDSIAYTELPSFFILLCYYSLPLIFFVSFIILFMKILKGKLKIPFCKKKYIFTALILGWLIPPILLFVITHIFNASFFHLRYFLWTSPFLALTIGLLLSSIYPLKTRFLCVILLALFGFDYLSNQHGYNENWKEAVKQINNIANDNNPLVISYSGFIESERLLWLTTQTHKDYLSAPLQYYGVNSNIIPIPADFSTSWGDKYFEEIIIPQITQFQNVLYVALMQRPVPNSNSYNKFRYSYEYHLKYFKEHNLFFNEIGRFGKVILFSLDKE